MIRRSTGSILFDTRLAGSLIFEPQYVQLAARLPYGLSMYGLGENDQDRYRHDFSTWRTWVGYAREQMPELFSNMYGVHPTYTGLEPDGNAHAVLFLNSAAQEWSTGPLPSFTYRTIGGLLDLYFFLGPTPQNVNSQYTLAVGRYPIPPYWSLGYHLCRFGYYKLRHMKAAKERTLKAGIPLDSQCADIDVMRDPGRDFTLSDRFKDLPEYAWQLRSQGIRLIPLLDPFIYGRRFPWEKKDLAELEGDRLDIWAKQPGGRAARGGGWFIFDAKYPDYTNPKTKV